MAHSRTKRIAAATLAAAAVISGGIAMAAPASAATIVTDCPARPTWSNGIELWESTGGNTCFEDDGTRYSPAGTWIPNVQDVTSGWNYADIYVVGYSHNPYHINPGQPLHLSATGVIVSRIYIHG